MYLVHFLNQDNYEFVVSLHSTRAAAEAAYEALLRRYVIEDGEDLPPKATWHVLSDNNGEGVHLYESNATGNPPRKSAWHQRKPRYRVNGRGRREGSNGRAAIAQGSPVEVIMKLGSYNYGTREATDTHGVSLGTFASMVEAEKAMGAARLPYSFWGYEQVSPIPLQR